MESKYQQISLYGKPVFTWYNPQPSTGHQVDLPTEACFAYVLEGQNQTLLKTNITVTAKKGSVILSLCGKTVGYMLSKSHTETATMNSIIVHFDREVLKRVFNDEKPQFWKELERPLKSWIAQQDASALVDSYFMGVLPFFEHKNALSEEILCLKLKEIVLLLLQTEESSNLNTIIRSLFSDKTFSFKEVIASNLYEPLDLNQLAAMTGNSLATFKRKFKTLYHQPPAKFIRQKRLEKAQQLLVATQKNMVEICYVCGFDNPSSFSRVFKAEFGLSPSEYRVSQIV